MIAYRARRRRATTLFLLAAVMILGTIIALRQRGPTHAESVDLAKNMLAVDECASACAMTDQESAYRAIHWVPTIRDAVTRARRLNLPVIIFYSNGDICTGRL